MSVLSDTAIAMLVCALAGSLARRISTRQYDALAAIANGLLAIADLASHKPAWAVVNGGVCAWYAHRWWNGGGGDDTKRRLRSLGRRFTPVRRTAPQGA